MRQWKLSQRFAVIISWALIIAPLGWFVVSTYLDLRPKTYYILSSGQKKGGFYYPLGDKMTQLFSDAFHTPGKFTNIESAGALENLRRIERNEAQLGFTQDGMTPGGYLGSSGAEGAFAKVRALAQLYRDPLQIMVKQGTAKSLIDLKGRIIFPGLEGSGTFEVTRYVLNRYGMDLDRDFRKPKVAIKTWDEATKALKNGNVDAGFFVIGYDVPLIKDLAMSGQFDLLSLDRAEAIAASLPSLEKVDINPGAYETTQTFPSHTIKTVAVREVLVCNNALSNKDAYQIVEALFRSSGQLVQSFPMMNRLSRIDPESNFYYELHKGASDFYRGNPKPSVDFPNLLSCLAASISIATFAILVPRQWRGRKIRRQMLLLSVTVDGKAEDCHKRVAELYSHAQSEYFQGKIARTDLDIISNLRDHIEQKLETKKAEDVRAG